MKNILLLAHDDAGEEARLQAALDLARALSGHIHCLNVEEMPYLIGTEYMLADAEAVMLDQVHEQQARNRKKIESRLIEEDVAWDWADVTGEFVSVLESHASLADIIVLNTVLLDDDRPDMRNVGSEILMRARKPVLAVPEAARRLDVAGSALIAWDGSTAICDTLATVCDLLARAEHVTMVQIGHISGTPIDEGAAYLSRHGIEPRLEYGAVDRGSIAEALLDLCAKRQPAYCVMGAYGHSRLRETLFGGTTRTMLSASPVPLLLGH
jgi:nucleotide-binding universal stress UspA family protein